MSEDLNLNGDLNQEPHKEKTSSPILDALSKYKEKWYPTEEEKEITFKSKYLNVPFVGLDIVPKESCG